MPCDIGPARWSRLSWLAALAIVWSMGVLSSAQSAPTITICKQTLPSLDTTGTSFPFVWSNGFGVQGGVPLISGQCHSYDIAGMDKFNVFTETVPAGWALVNIACVTTNTQVSIFGANPNPAFQSGDTSVKMDLVDANVTCTFTNRRLNDGKKTGYLNVCKDVIDHTGGSSIPSTFPIHLECSTSPNIWIDLPLAANTCSTNNSSMTGYSGTPPTPAGTVCRVQENGSPPWPLMPLSFSHPDAGPMPSVPTRRCPAGFASWTTSFPNGANATIPAGGTATIRVLNELRCGQKQNDCEFNRNLSTGVVPWKVNGGPTYVTSAHPSWAGGFAGGAQWIQPTNDGNPVSHAAGTYRYQFQFQVPKCALDANGRITVKGTFAADNGAMLRVGSNPPVNCAGNPNLCFQQANVTPFTETLTGTGPHVIAIYVTNDETFSGVIAHVAIQ